MQLALSGTYLNIKLNLLEKIVALHGALSLPFASIIQASAQKPDWDFAAVRAPGTCIPFLLKAGTYHSCRGMEFWCAEAGQTYLVIDLIGWDYNRLVLSVSRTAEWAERINQALRNK